MAGLTSKTFWYDAIERSVKTIAQSMVALLGASQVPGLLNLDITALLSVSGLAGLISLLTSIGSAGVNGDGASLVVETKKLK